MTDEQQVPDAALLRHLLTLRFMLVDATRWATQAGPERLTTAVILLDGVVERAMNLAAAEIGVTVGPRDTLPQIADKLRTKAPDWKPRHWRDIDDLHRARNSAQHAGQRPHPDDLGPWTTAVGAFVRDVVDTHLGLDLDRVALTDAVQDPRLREMLEQAAAALEGGSPAYSVGRSVTATVFALSSWTNLQNGRTSIQDLFANPRGPGARMSAVEQRIELSTFAQDPAEVSWFTVLMNDFPSAMDRDDAERALAFATSWILGYEAALHSWVQDRHERAQRAARRVRVGDGTAYIADGRVMLNGDGIIAALVLADVPAQDQYEAWRTAVERLRDGEASDIPKGSRIQRDGTVRLTGRDAEDLRSQLVALDGALKQAEARLDADHAADAVRQGEEARRASDYRESLAAAGDLPEWAASASLTPDMGGTAVLLTINHDFAWLLAVGGGLQTRLEADARVTAVRRDTGSDRLYITPRLEPVELVSLLDEIDVEVQEQARDLAARQDAMVSAGAEHTAALLGILRELDERAAGA
ncbi:hypothetical protein CHO01_35940 [Cellulomonas hominis]|uniref:Uncharacterized protein n=1 Tax=Cellulomonas hominis TaxID=156981 RepID=A0A511FKU2_9CELL|nr:hypothetical protein [Cellulomonas hominis]MBB5474823.1 hypothetical protein [Cellulomonas hominis]NKY05661.1 hypothetical protein [Cellulomonas hominis]GEL48478.1 hypothetical protein CHO01_35940 [Cellulomonas hominis]